MRRLISSIFEKFGYKIIREKKGEFSPEFLEEYTKISDLTMVDRSGALAVWDAVDHVVNRSIEGDLVECGIWRGGISILMARRLATLGSKTRKLWLFDTFEGMSEPTEVDMDKHGVAASDQLSQASKTDEENNVWAYASDEAVASNFRKSGVDPSICNFVKGKVEDTIPKNMPKKISILRLDTDWYESTKHELEYLYPKLSTGGVLLIDDYQYWGGCHQAVEEYFSDKSQRPFFATLANGSLVSIKI
ncbi:MAG: macrocin O-methyltransferase [Robiginitomaculum sp.]|nr:MAG: macrocin O-methyltransferase [Robiginitomaculum sp.]